MQMTIVDRDIGLALLKRLQQRGLISEETYVSACNSRFFDASRFSDDAESNEIISAQEEQRNDEY